MLSTLAMVVTGGAVVVFAWMGRRSIDVRINEVLDAMHLPLREIEKAMAVMDMTVQGQYAVMAFADVFRSMAILFLIALPLLFFAQALGRVKFVLSAQAIKAPNATINCRNHALFSFKAFACGEIVPGADKCTLQLLQFQRAA